MVPPGFPENRQVPAAELHSWWTFRSPVWQFCDVSDPKSKVVGDLLGDQKVTLNHRVITCFYSCLICIYIYNMYVVSCVLLLDFTFV